MIIVTAFSNQERTDITLILDSKKNPYCQTGFDGLDSNK